MGCVVIEVFEFEGDWGLLVEVGDVGGLGSSMFNCHYVDDVHTGYEQHAVDGVGQ
jgi:hypothetical protein